MTNLLAYLRQHVLAVIALVFSLLSLGGASYAAFSLPAGSVGNRQLRDRAITAAKLNPASVAASIRAWANLSYASVWRVEASSSDVQVTTVATGEIVRWRHTRFARSCMASVTPQLNFTPGGPGGTGTPDGYVTASFEPQIGFLQIDGFSTGGTTRQAQAVSILILCPSPGSHRVNR